MTLAAPRLWAARNVLRSHPGRAGVLVALAAAFWGGLLAASVAALQYFHEIGEFGPLLVFAGENASELTLEYGNIPRASVGAIQRRLLVLEQEGAGQFLGEPALDLFDFMRTGANGYGNVNILPVAAAEFFTDVKHRGLIHFPFTDHHGPGNFNGIKRPAHRFGRRFIGGDLVAFANPSATCESRRFSDPDQFECQITVHL